MGARHMRHLRRSSEDGTVRVHRRRREDQPRPADWRRARRVAGKRRWRDADTALVWWRRVLVSRRAAAALSPRRRGTRDAPRRRRHRRDHLIGYRPTAGHGLRVARQPILGTRALHSLLSWRVWAIREVHREAGRDERYREASAVLG